MSSEKMLSEGVHLHLVIVIAIRAFQRVFITQHTALIGSAKHCLYDYKHNHYEA